MYECNLSQTNSFQLLLHIHSKFIFQLYETFYLQFLLNVFCSTLKALLNFNILHVTNWKLVHTTNQNSYHYDQSGLGIKIVFLGIMYHNIKLTVDLMVDNK